MHKSQLCRVPTIPGGWDKIQYVGNAGGLKYSCMSNSTCSSWEQQVARESSLPMVLPDINTVWNWRGFPHFLSTVNLKKIVKKTGSWETFFFFFKKVHRCKGIMLVNLRGSTKNIYLRRWTTISLHSYIFIICKAMPITNFMELYILTEIEFLFPKCWKMT